MAETELSIILRLLDQASAKLKAITTDLKKETAGITEESKKLKEQDEKTHKSIQGGLKESSKQLKSFRREMFIVTIAIATIMMAVKEWGKHNYQTKETLDSIQISLKNITATLGSIFIPMIKNAAIILQWLNYSIFKPIINFINLLQIGIYNLAAAYNDFVSKIAKTLGFASWAKELEKNRDELKKFAKELRDMMVENIPQTDAMTIKFKEMTDALEKLNLMYLTGAISAQQYYDVLTSNNVANFQNMQMQMGLMQQLAAQENLMRNQSLMDFSADVTARMGLLKTLQDYHHTVYSTMMDFTKMFITQFSTGMTTALTSIIMGTKKASEAFKEFGIAMVTAIVEFVIQYGIQMLIAATLSKLIMASTIAQATAIAAAWLPAAIFASIATMGGASAAGAAGFATATASSLALGAAAIAASKAIDLGTIHVRKHEGGLIKAHRGLAIDEVPIIAQTGEGILSRRGMMTLGGEAMLNRLNAGRSAGDIIINIDIDNPIISKESDIDYLVEVISQRIAREVERIR